MNRPFNPRAPSHRVPHPIRDPHSNPVTSQEDGEQTARSPQKESTWGLARLVAAHRDAAIGANQEHGKPLVCGSRIASTCGPVGLIDSQEAGNTKVGANQEVREQTARGERKAHSIVHQ